MSISRRPRVPAMLGAALALLAVVLGPSLARAGKPDILQLETSSIEVSASVITSFDGSDTTRFGKLDWRGGLNLSSRSQYFGGFSGLAVLDDGQALVTVSDAGFWLTADLAYEGIRLTGIGGARIGPLRALSGKRLERRRDRDAEAVGVVSSNRRETKLVIGFENNARVGRFALTEAGISPPSAYLVLPKAMQALRGNKSIESIAYLSRGPLAGNFISFGEQLADSSGNRLGWLFGGAQGRTLRLVPAGNYDVSDVAALDDGGVLVLERRFRWSEGISIRIRRLSPRELQASLPMRGETIFEAQSGTVLDNMEGIAVHRSKRGETIVTLISDDNFNFFQTTVLLQFALVE